MIIARASRFSADDYERAHCMMDITACVFAWAAKLPYVSPRSWGVKSPWMISATHCANAVSSDNALEDVEPSTNVKAMAARDRMIILSFDVIDFIILPH